MKIEASPVSETTRRDADALGSCVQRKFASASIWTDAMLAALRNGVKGGKWHSLIDKVFRLDTLALGWAQVLRPGLFEKCRSALFEMRRSGLSRAAMEMHMMQQSAGRSSM